MRATDITDITIEIDTSSLTPHCSHLSTLSSVMNLCIAQILSNYPTFLLASCIKI